MFGVTYLGNWHLAGCTTRTRGAQGAEHVKGSRISCRSRWLGASIAAAAATLVLIPTAGFAVNALDDGASRLGANRPSMFTPASVDPQLARFIAERSGTSRLKRFTPAGVDARSSRTVTVAVRVNAEEARAIQVRSAIAAAQDGVSDSAPGVRIASTRYNLGLSRGYQNFAQSAVQPSGQVAGRSAVLSKSLSDAAIPNLAEFRPSRGTAREETRFAARIADETTSGTAAGVAPRRDSVDEQALDIAGSYRLTRNLDVTAGLRYSQERDRAVPLQKSGEKDNQAVYIGTQFRF